MTQRKTKMISFRLSPEEYDRLSEACEVQGVGSISELARVALHRILEHPGEPARRHTENLEHEVESLRNRVAVLSSEIDVLSKKISSRTLSAAAGASAH